MCVGQATRISEYLAGHDKTYRATIRLGSETDTYDADGQTIATREVNVSEADLRAALATFVGAIEQVPPMHSAIKRDGRKLYELARAGIEVDRPARSVTIHSIDLLDFTPPDVTLEVRCSAGTYIRSLAHDLGARLLTGAHLSALARIASGPYQLAAAVELDVFETAARDGQWQPYLSTIDQALDDWPVAVLTGADRDRAVTGGPIEALPIHGTRCRAHDEHGELIALLVYDQKKRHWRADKVLSNEH